MTLGYPDLSKRLDAIRDAVAWASKVKVLWIDQTDRVRAREANIPWIELQPRRIEKTNRTDVMHLDLETAGTEGTLEFPRQEVSVSHCTIHLQARGRSRSQRPLESGWYALTRVQNRINTTYPKNKWIRPNNLAFSEMGSEVLNMPTLQINDNRIENNAILEFAYDTVLCEVDAANVGTWIDRVLVSSDIQTMDDSLQLDEEVMGYADSVHVVDEDGNFVVDENGHFITEG